MGSVNNPAIMNLRDFVEGVGVDPSRPNMSSALQLKTSLNIPPLQAEEHCDDIDMNETFFVDAGNVFKISNGGKSKQHVVTMGAKI